MKFEFTIGKQIYEFIFTIGKKLVMKTPDTIMGTVGVSTKKVIMLCILTAGVTVGLTVGGRYLYNRWWPPPAVDQQQLVVMKKKQKDPSSSTSVPLPVVLTPTSSSKRYCSLCFEEIIKENEMLELDCFCKNCFDLSDTRFLKDLCTPIVIEKKGDDWVEEIKPITMERAFTDALPSSSRIDSGRPRSPRITTVAPFDLIRKKEKLDIWLAPQGITESVKTFIKYKGECTRETLPQYIQGLLSKGFPIKIKQAYIPALFRLAMRSRNFTYNIAPTGKLSIPSEEDTWISIMVEVSYRALLNRIRLLVMLDAPDDVLDPVLKYIYLTHKTPTNLGAKAYTFYIKRILFESGLGWPGFEKKTQADEYLQGLPPNQEIIEIKNGSTGETVAWIVGEKYKSLKQLQLQLKNKDKK